MSSSLPRRLGLVAVVVLLFAAGWALGFSRATARDHYENVDLFVEVLSRVEQYYVDPVEPKKLMNGAINGMLRRLDPFSSYLDEKAPWKKIKEDKQAAATSLNVAINVISRLKTMLAPFLPFSSQKVHEYLGFNGRVEDAGWQPQPVPPGQKLREPKPLFVKLDESVIEEETKRIGA